jgi:hypothetical protein
MGEGAGERLGLAFLVGVLLISFPVLAIFNRPDPVGGIPILYLYLFAVWALGIVVAFVMARRQ